MRDWTEDQDEEGGWLEVEVGLVVLMQVLGAVGLIAWLLG